MSPVLVRPVRYGCSERWLASIATSQPNSASYAVTGRKPGSTGGMGTNIRSSDAISGSWSNAMSGRFQDAERLMDQIVGYATDLGILSEKVDPHIGRMLGNVHKRSATSDSSAQPMLWELPGTDPEPPSGSGQYPTCRRSFTRASAGGQRSATRHRRRDTSWSSAGRR